MCARRIPGGLFRCLSGHWLGQIHYWYNRVSKKYVWYHSVTPWYHSTTSNWLRNSQWR